MATSGAPGLHERIDVFLAEFRMVIPAMGALLGFQLTVSFQAAFEALPMHEKSLHFAGLCSSALSLLFLLMPGAYHRRVHGARETEELLQVSRKAIGFAFAFMTLAITISVYLQASLSFGSDVAAAAAGLASLAAFVVGWWVVPWRLLRRTH